MPHWRQSRAAASIWIKFDPATMNLGLYLWLGEMLGKPVVLGDRVGRHSRGPAGAKRHDRTFASCIAASSLLLERMEDLAIRLFGSATDDEVHPT
jgi:hypothetical protein